MQHDYSSPDGVSTADLTLEHDCNDLERLVSGHLRESIANCENPAMLLSTLCSIDKVSDGLATLKKQAETKVHGLAFVAELIA